MKPCRQGFRKILSQSFTCNDLVFFSVLPNRYENQYLYSGDIFRTHCTYIDIFFSGAATLLFPHLSRTLLISLGPVVCICTKHLRGLHKFLSHSYINQFFASLPVLPVSKAAKADLVPDARSRNLIAIHINTFFLPFMDAFIRGLKSINLNCLIFFALNF